MTEPDVANTILASPKYSAMLHEVSAASIAHHFQSVERIDEKHEVDWSLAMFLASAIGTEAPQIAQDGALRLVQGCLRDDAADPAYRHAAAILLERMGNWPALDLASNRELIERDLWTDAPSPLLLDVMRRRLELSIPTANGGTLAANTFQRNFWSAAVQNEWVSVSAPTSAGKSYVVKRWFENQLNSGAALSAVYLVPTRALIEEVSADLRQDKTFEGVGIYTLPWDPGIGGSSRSIFVVTQERLHILQERDRTFSASLIFVDEAQKFGDDSRGVLLQRVLHESTSRNPHAQVLLASPLSSNPEVLLQDAPRAARRRSIASQTVTVNQNLIWVNQMQRNTTTWSVSMIVDGEDHEIGRLTLPARPVQTSMRLSLIAATMGREKGSNVVYVNGAADAEKTARQIFDALSEEADVSQDAEIIALRELIQRTIHEQYALAAVLTRGVAFHYGNMPLLVRTEVERLFKIGKIRFLVCTSTLLEGVNLPCTSIFVRGPRRGPGRVMSLADFWNLAGRAGRWGKEFEGNIICIDTDDAVQWPERPKVRAQRPLTRATADVLSDVRRLISYVDAGADVNLSADYPVGESVFSYLAGQVASGAQVSELQGVDLSPEMADAVQSSIETALSSVSVPVELLRKHAGISPMSMQQLLERLLRFPDKQSLVLLAPENRRAATSYASAIGLITESLDRGFGTNSGRHMQISIMLVSWMRGIPLARLIEERVDFNARRSAPQSLPAVIRQTIADVEQVARFQAPKYLACYQDLVRLASGDASTEQPELPDIAMMLELGVSRQTDMSLMTLGLSRTSVVALGEYMVADRLSPAECSVWLQSQDLSTFDLPELVRREIRDTIGLPPADPSRLS